METREANRQADALLRPAFESIGFRRRGLLTYSLKRDKFEIFLLLGLRRDPRGYFAMAGSLGISFDQLVDLIGGSGRHNIHLNIPFHLTGGDHSFKEWNFSNHPQLEVAVSEIMCLIIDWVIPFADRNDSLEKMCIRLESLEPKDWYALTRQQRNVLLVASKWVLGAREAALHLMDVELSKTVGALPKMRADLEALQETLHRDAAARNVAG